MYNPEAAVDSLLRSSRGEDLLEGALWAAPFATPVYTFTSRMQA